MLNPVKTYSFQFTSDGISTSIVIDASLAPIGEDFTGNVPTAVLSPVVSSAFTGTLSGVTASLNGTTITFTFAQAPPQLDNNAAVILYTASFVLQFPE